MKRFILSTCSVLLATAAIAPTAQALPKLDPAFDLQTRRLSELDRRTKSDDYSASEYSEYSESYYSQPATEASGQPLSAEQEAVSTDKPTEWKAPETWEEEAEPVFSLIQQRHEVLDRRR